MTSRRQNHVNFVNSLFHLMKLTSDVTYDTSKVRPEAFVQCVCIARNYMHIIGMICYSSIMSSYSQVNIT